jgi:uncharacterized protein
VAWLPPPDPGATCLLTGASSGIGAALARRLAASGYGVTLLARREERLRELAAELRDRHGVRAEVLACDLADAGARESVPARLAELGLRVDLLANVAGLGTYGDFATAERWGQLAQVRVMSEAVVDLTHAFAPAMAERRSGAILIVSSSVGLMTSPRYATYGATRAFCVAFGEALHAELRPRGVAVSTVCPGGVSSEFFEANGAQPVQRVMPSFLWRTPEQVAAAAVEGLAANRRLVVPGPMRALVAGASLLPRGARLRLMGGMMRLADA